MEQEIGRIKKSDKIDVVIRVDEYKGNKGITIRECIDGAKYKGFTRSGTRIPIEKLQELKAIINNIT